MQNTKILFVAAFAGASLAQTTAFPDPACASSVYALLGAAPTTPPEIESAILEYYPEGAESTNGDLLLSPSAYVSSICSIATQLPEPVLSQFATWGSDLLEFAATKVESYDWIITKCVTTGEAAASITSYIHSIASHPGELCNIEASPTNGTTSAAPYPTPSSNATSSTTGSPTASVSLAGASMPTGVLAGAAAVGGLLGAVALL
ncbi:hypothetical protein NPX13_g10410 [Xylaria arbuscula]|uniref:Infection structure specific protein n=1 Tax=Xylaria arbuscula TaxID=114810 RepID=A0A9W8N541_9PEZI|nr:hypothetical protein NPX13_g10410 [Xylaria arbuscula]